MKILFLTLGPEIMAGSRTRVYQYLPHLKKSGVKTKVINYHPAIYIKQGVKASQSAAGRLFFTQLGNFVRLLNLLKVVLCAPFYDLLFIQKVVLPRKVRRLLYKLDKVMVLDFDDSTFFLRNKPETVAEIFSKASLIIVENDYNKEYVQKYCQNILTIIGPIDTDRYYHLPKRKPKKAGVVVGWIGHPDSADYLLSLEAVFKELAIKYPHMEVKAIGAGNNHIQGVKFDNVEWSLKSEVEHLRQFDIGVMPLLNDPVAWGKGGYKILQYMAMGIPSVASPVGVNIRLIIEGENGYLASSPEEWIEKISLLIESEELREQLGKRARQIAVEKYSYHVATPHLLNALKGVYDQSHRR